MLPLALQSIICLNLFLIYHIYLWVLFCVEVLCGSLCLVHRKTPPSRKTPPAASPWTCSPQNKEELSFSLPGLWDAAEMAMVDWDRGSARLKIYILKSTILCVKCVLLAIYLSYPQRVMFKSKGLVLLPSVFIHASSCCGISFLC